MLARGIVCVLVVVVLVGDNIVVVVVFVLAILAVAVVGGRSHQCCSAWDGSPGTGTGGFDEESP